LQEQVYSLVTEQISRPSTAWFVDLCAVH